jgi:hypothetical protein
MLAKRYSKWAEGRKIALQELEKSKEEYHIWYDLTYCFNYNLGSGGLGADDYMIGAFGSVLSNLPKSAFDKLRKMENVFYIHTSNPGAEVKLFVLEKDIKKNKWLKIVNFPYDSEFMPLEALQGEIVHELAHVSLQHKTNSLEEDIKTDKLAEKWGFHAEIKAMKNFWGKIKLEQEDLNNKGRGREMTKEKATRQKKLQRFDD